MGIESQGMLFGSKRKMEKPVILIPEKSSSSNKSSLK